MDVQRSIALLHMCSVSGVDLPHIQEMDVNRHFFLLVNEKTGVCETSAERCEQRTVDLSAPAPNLAIL